MRALIFCALLSSFEICCGQRKESSKDSYVEKHFADEVVFDQLLDNQLQMADPNRFPQQQPYGFNQFTAGGGEGSQQQVQFQQEHQQHLQQQQHQQHQHQPVSRQQMYNSQDDGHQTKMKRIEEIGQYYDVEYNVLLGRGHFASVFRGYDKRRHGHVAVKKISRMSQSEKTLRTEIEALLRIKGHPNIVSLFDVFVGKDHVILTMELLEGGELFNRIVSNGAYSERDASRHFRQLSEALVYMHKNNIVHRDLKPENLVLKTPSPDSEILISDFGLSKILQEDQTLMATVCGTNAYAAPEVGFNNLAVKQGSNQYDAKCDTWSLGVILYVILAAYHPFDPRGNITDDLTLRDRICTFQWDMSERVWTHMSNEVKDLLKSLICPANRRLTAEEILHHKWITDGQNMPAKPIKGFSDRSLRYFVTSSEYSMRVDESYHQDEDATMIFS